MKTFVPVKTGTRHHASVRTAKPNGMAKWYEKKCEECWETMKVCTEWEHEPRFCKSCKAKHDAKWYEKRCEECGEMMKVCREWEHEPKFCKGCKAKHDAMWYEKKCEECGNTMKVCREWEREPKFCKSCKEKYGAKDVACSQCGKLFRISTGLQLKCKERGWDLPTRCEECKHDALLIKGAIGALRRSVSICS